MCLHYASHSWWSGGTDWRPPRQPALTAVERKRGVGGMTNNLSDLDSPINFRLALTKFLTFCSICLSRNLIVFFWAIRRRGKKGGRSRKRGPERGFVGCGGGVTTIIPPLPPTCPFLPTPSSFLAPFCSEEEVSWQ